MNNHPDYIPYVYEIVFKKTGQKYIGARYANKIRFLLPEQDLGVQYFSSSNQQVLAYMFQKQNPELFEYNILACFPNDAEAARIFERNLHIEYDVARNPKFLNKAKACKNFYPCFTDINPNAKVVRIYSDDGVLYDEVGKEEHFARYLKQEGLPASLEASARRGGKPFLSSGCASHDVVNHRMIQYKGWYAVFVNEDGSEQMHYQKERFIRYVMLDLDSNVVETFDREKTLKRETINRGWPMNSISKSLRNGGEPLYANSRDAEKTKARNAGLLWLQNYCFVKTKPNGQFVHEWALTNRKDKR